MKTRIILSALLVAALGAGAAVAQTQTNQDVGGWAPKPKPPAPPGGGGNGGGPKTISRGANDPAPGPGPGPGPVPPPPPPIGGGGGNNGPRAQGTDMMLANDPQAIQQAMQDAGYHAEMSTDDQGNPKIIGTASRSTYWVLFLDCQSSDGCLGVEFYVSYELDTKPSLETMNQFNNDYRYIRAFTNDDGQPRMMMDVLMRDDGLGKATFLEYLRLWTVIMPSFEDAIGF